MKATATKTKTTTAIVAGSCGFSPYTKLSLCPGASARSGPGLSHSASYAHPIRHGQQQSFPQTIQETAFGPRS